MALRSPGNHRRPRRRNGANSIRSPFTAWEMRRRARAPVTDDNDGGRQMVRTSSVQALRCKEVGAEHLPGGALRV